MKLLSKPQATNQIAKDNEELLDTNIRLRQYAKDITQKLNTIKEDYEPDKVRLLEEFERFCNDIDAKKSRKLHELAYIEEEITKKKDVYYGLITKQDALEEKLHNLTEKERKLDMRENFIIQLEEKQRQLTQNHA